MRIDFVQLSGMELDYLFLSFMLYSFLGWLFESTVISLWESGHFLNRGSLLSPFCPVYGGGCVLGIIMAHNIPNAAVQFLASACLCIGCEYLCASILEDIFHVKLWDYSGIAFNFKGRVCLLGFMFFGIMTTVISRFIEPIVVACFDSVPPQIINLTAILLAVLLAVDTLLSGVAFSRRSRKLYRFYIRYHVMLNREFRSLSYSIQRWMPEWMLARLRNTQAAILQKNRSLNDRHIQRRENLEEKIKETIGRFRKS